MIIRNTLLYSILGLCALASLLFITNHKVTPEELFDCEANIYFSRSGYYNCVTARELAIIRSGLQSIEVVPYVGCEAP